MSIIRYPVKTESLTFSHYDKVFLDSSFILTSMVFSRDFNKYYSIANDVLKQIRESEAEFYITPTVFSEVVDSLLALLFGNDIVLYSRNEKDKQRYTDYELAKICIENKILSEIDLSRLAMGRPNQVSFKSYINSFSKSKNRKPWLDSYIIPAVTNTERFIWNYKVKFFTSLDEHDFIMRIQPIMQGMRLRSHDALHFTTAIWEGCSYFITNDEDYKSNPFHEVIQVVLITDKRQ